MILTIPTGVCVCVCVCVCSSSSSFYGLLEGVALSTGMFEVFLYFFFKSHQVYVCVLLSFPTSNTSPTEG
jgi:hypothetical protein